MTHELLPRSLARYFSLYFHLWSCCHHFVSHFALECSLSPFNSRTSVYWTGHKYFICVSRREPSSTKSLVCTIVYCARFICSTGPLNLCIATLSGFVSCFSFLLSFACCCCCLCLLDQLSLVMQWIAWFASQEQRREEKRKRESGNGTREKARGEGKGMRVTWSKCKSTFWPTRTKTHIHTNCDTKIA